MSETALYIGENGNHLLDGTLLVSGVTVANISYAEAHASDLWSPIGVADIDADPPAIFDGGGPRGPQIGVLDGGTS